MLEALFDNLRPVLLVIDVVIVAYIFYRIYNLLNRTRAMQLLVGFGIILILDIASHQLHLETLSWLITNVSSYLVIGLIILLQPELRRLFADLGRMRAFQWINPATSVPIEEICEAVKSMAQKKVGSIIVLLREIRPQQIIDYAVRMDSLISREILETIFFKDSPLHDGAVIIEGNRIAAASCYLPLTSSTRGIKKTHGARHRAAMGMSEESDAVIIVTSEETGQISVIQNGEMTANVQPLNLPVMLIRMLESGRAKKSGDESR
jgi:diadenylate cyclase